MNMNKIKVGAKIKVNAENPTTAHTLVRWQQV
jgi:TusA-related sulfurtransferase